MADYKPGDIVKRKDDLSLHNRLFIFLGTVSDQKIHRVREVQEVMGSDVEIGIFVATPLHVDERRDGWGYFVPVILASTGLYEKG